MQSSTKKPVSLFAARLAKNRELSGAESRIKQQQEQNDSQVPVLSGIIERQSHPIQSSFEFVIRAIPVPAPSSVHTTAETVAAAATAITAITATTKDSPQDFESLNNQIARENDARIAAMSKEELLDAQKQIMATFSDETIAKFRALAEKRSVSSSASSSNVKPSPATAKTMTINPLINSIIEEKKNISNPLESSLIPVTESKISVRKNNTFDNVDPIQPPLSESQKIEWMNPVLSTSPFDDNIATNSESSNDLRFSLTGNIIPVGVDLPTHLGLHHHGDDPASAGYTIKELVYLARSSMASQRSVCIKTLASIVKLFMSNAYSPSETVIVGEALRAYMVLIHIRAAIDDSSATIISIGINGVATALGIINRNSDNSPSSSTTAIGWNTAETIQNLYKFTKNGHFLFEQSRTSLETISKKLSGVIFHPLPKSQQQQLQMPNKEDEEASSILFQDVVSSLAETHLFERLHILIVSKKLNAVDTELVLRILVVMAQSGVKTANAIAGTSALVQSIRIAFLAIPWPQTTTKTGSSGGKFNLKLTVLALQLMQVLCQANIAGPAVSQILESANAIIRFISPFEGEDEEDDENEKADENNNQSKSKNSINNKKRQLVLSIQTESFRLLSILFEYGSSTSLFINLRNEFVGIAMRMLQTLKTRQKSNKKESSSGSSSKGLMGTDDNAFGFFVLSFWRMVCSAAKLARNGQDGISAETMAPLVSVGVEVFNFLIQEIPTRSNNPFSRSERILLSLLLTLFGEHIQLLVENSSALNSFLGVLKIHEMRLLPAIRKAIWNLSYGGGGGNGTAAASQQQKTDGNAYPLWSSKFIFGVPVADEAHLVSAIDATIEANIVESAIVFDSKLIAKTKQQQQQKVDDIDEICVDVLRGMLSLHSGQEQTETDWCVVYGRGRNDLRAVILLRLCDSIRRSVRNEVAADVANNTSDTTAAPDVGGGGGSSGGRDEVIIASVLAFMRDCLPTDSDIFSHLFETVKFYPGFRESVPIALRILENEFVIASSSSASSGVSWKEKEDEDEEEVQEAVILQKSFFITFRQNNLPVCPDWMFIPIFQTRFTTKQQVVTILTKTLQFIIRLETFSDNDNNGVSNPFPPAFNILKLSSLMRIYLFDPLPDRTDIYTIANIPSLLESLIKIYTTTTSKTSRTVTTTLEHVHGGRGEFYKIYQALISQYTATSFADPVFTRLLTVPLAMTYPSDFRAAFWADVPVETTMMAAKSSGGANDEILPPFGIDVYLGPSVETSLVVIDLYVGALVRMHQLWQRRQQQQQHGGRTLPTGFFWTVAITHVARWWFGGIEEEGVVGMRRRVVAAIVGMNNDDDNDGGGYFLGQKENNVCLEFVVRGGDRGEVERRANLWNLAAFM
ncbi:RNA polymerase II associated protein 1, partial [Physocladia obscura]